MRTTVDQRLSLEPDQRQDLRDLADEMGLSINKTVARATRAQRLLWEWAKAEAAAMEPASCGALLLRISRELGSVELLGKTMQHGVLKADRSTPCIRTIDAGGEEAIFYIDGLDRIVMQRTRGTDMDHFIVQNGRLVLSDREGDAVAVH